MSEPCSNPDATSADRGLKKLHQPWSRSVRITIGLIVYVYSIGPMFWYWYEAENLGGNSLVRVVYMPLRLLCAIPPFENWLNNYIKWWIA
ncbi:MAG: hypothetical protein HQ518_23350 [Rhodopirellula sp.]|nr:hypothetical protein [Rhodopirellula sp.]